MKIFRQESDLWGVLFDTDTLRYRINHASYAQEADIVIPLQEDAPREDILTAPVRAFIELTERCNIECTHCFVSSTPRSYLGADTDVFIRLLDELRAFRVIGLCFTGGEPTVRKDWFEIVSYAKGLGFSISMNTNGVYARPQQIVNKLAELNLDLITVSLDGMEAAHDCIRGQGNFSKTARSLQLMSESGLPVRINTVLSRENVKDVAELIKFASELVKEINLINLKPVGRARFSVENCLSFEENFATAKLIHSLREEYPKLRIRHFGEYLFTEREVSAGENQLKKTLYPYGNSTINISADGSYWPHGFSPYQSELLKLGENALDQIADVWFSSENIEKLRKWLEALTQRCQRCEEYMVRCIGQNFEMEIARLLGRIDHNPYCISTEPVPQLEVLGEVTDLST